jgi:hypothetical protein
LQLLKSFIAFAKKIPVKKQLGAERLVWVPPPFSDSDATIFAEQADRQTDRWTERGTHR